jgi:hypothetical protein
MNGTISSGCFTPNLLPLPWLVGAKKFGIHTIRYEVKNIKDGIGKKGLLLSDGGRYNSRYCYSGNLILLLLLRILIPDTGVISG